MNFDYYRQLVKGAFRALNASRRRSILTMLGIIIGVAAVIIIMAIGAGAQSLILSQVASFGTDLVGVLPGKSEKNGPPASVFGVAITTLTLEDANALNSKNNVPHAVAIEAVTRGAGSVSWREQSYDTNFTGTSADYLTVEGGELEEGRFFTKEEVDGIARVVVLGSTVREEIFGQTNPVGQTVRLKNTTFTVVGLMKERGTVAFQNYDDQILLPVTSMQKLIAGVHHLGLLRLKVDASENIDQTLAYVEQTLRERHGITDQSGESDDFSVRSSRDGIEALQTITGGLSFFLAAMAALSLLVGGIGIMNIMLIRVVERTREIGLRQAVGARRFDIMAQFLTEAIAITLSGGVIGIIIGEIVSSVLTLVARQLGYEWPFSFSPLAISLAVCVSMAIGLIFGLYPAAKASKLDPIEALRYE
jgi:putative ABC transport system permease protein